MAFITRLGKTGILFCVVFFNSWMQASAATTTKLEMPRMEFNNSQNDKIGGNYWNLLPHGVYVWPTSLTESNTDDENVKTTKSYEILRSFALLTDASTEWHGTEQDASPSTLDQDTPRETVADPMLTGSRSSNADGNDASFTRTGTTRSTSKEYRTTLPEDGTIREEMSTSAGTGLLYTASGSEVYKQFYSGNEEVGVTTSSQPDGNTKYVEVREHTRPLRAEGQTTSSRLDGTIKYLEVEDQTRSLHVEGHTISSYLEGNTTSLEVEERTRSLDVDRQTISPQLEGYTNSTKTSLDSSLPPSHTGYVSVEMRTEEAASSSFIKEEKVIEFGATSDPCSGIRCSFGAVCHAGECKCPPSCRHEVKPICASNGQTYMSECDMVAHMCVERVTLVIIADGPCPVTTTANAVVIRESKENDAGLDDVTLLVIYICIGGVVCIAIMALFLVVAVKRLRPFRSSVLNVVVRKKKPSARNAASASSEYRVTIEPRREDEAASQHAIPIGKPDGLTIDDKVMEHVPNRHQTQKQRPLSATDTNVVELAPDVDAKINADTPMMEFKVDKLEKLKRNKPLRRHTSVTENSVYEIIPDEGATVDDVFQNEEQIMTRL